MSPTDRARNPRPWRALGWLSVSGLIAGCSQGEIPVVGIAHPTLIEVAPSVFLGEVPCLPSPGAMRRYVATIYDVSLSDPDAGEGGAGGAGPVSTGFALPSSPPVPCMQSVGFSRVVPGNKYRAEIDGYDRDDLVALASGARVLYDPNTGERVSRRWTIRCGDDLPTKSVEAVARTVGECKTITDSAPNAPSLVEVSIEQALDGLECGSEPGSVDHFEVEPPSGLVGTAACGETVTLAGLAPTRSALTLPLRAFEAGASSPTWGTVCVADVIAGVTTTATCLPLASTGALEVLPEDALRALGLDCGASFVELTVELTDGNPDTRRVTPANCSRPLTFQGRAPGPATARASARLSDGTTVEAASCTGTVEPGTTAPSTCVREP